MTACYFSRFKLEPTKRLHLAQLKIACSPTCVSVTLAPSNVDLEEILDHDGQEVLDRSLETAQTEESKVELEKVVLAMGVLLRGREK